MCSAACTYLVYNAHSMHYRVYETCLAYLRNVDWGDVCEDLNLSELHKIVLGLSLKSLDAESSSHPGNLDEQDRLSRTALWYACSFGREDYIAILLSHGANPNVGVNQLPLRAAIGLENLNCMRLLLEHEAILPVQAFMDATMYSDLGLYTHGFYQYVEPKQMVDIDKLLLEHGFDFDCQDIFGSTMLMHCCKIGPPRSGYLSYRSFRKERLEFLLEVGVDLELEDDQGDTALAYAIMHANVYAVKRLFHAGACLNLGTRHGHTILHLAVLCGDNLGIVQALIDSNTSVIFLEAQDKRGLSAFDLLKRRVRQTGCMWPKSKDDSQYLSYPPVSTLGRLECLNFYTANTPEEEAEIIAAFDVLFRKLQDERHVPVQARYPTSTRLLSLADDEESESDGVLREVDFMPGAWPGDQARITSTFFVREESHSNPVHPVSPVMLGSLAYSV